MEKGKFLLLLDRYLKGEATPEEHRFIDDFFAAYESKSENLELTEDEDLLWQAIHSKIDSREKNISITQPRSTRPLYRRGWVKISALAASLVLFAALIGFWVNLSNQRYTGWRTLTADSGQRRKIQLPDGSVVHLNAASSLSYPEKFSTAVREVKLTGEAFFEVTKDAHRPFLVHTENLRTTVLGTSFNVRAYPTENIVVTVATGKVSVGTAAKTEKDQKQLPAIILTPGLQATYDPASKQLTTATVSPEIYTDWRNNIIRFQNTSLGEAAETLSKWYGITIVFEHDKIKHCRISGQFKNPELKDVFESLQYMYPVQYKFLNTNKILLYGKGC